MAYYDFNLGKWIYDSPQLPTVKVAAPQPQPTVSVAPPAPTPQVKVAQPAFQPRVSVAPPAPTPQVIAPKPTLSELQKRDAERIAQSQSYFAPTTQTRIRDVVREVASIPSNIGKKATETSLNFLAPVGERFGAGIASVQQKSLDPLKESFQAQREEMFVQPGDAPEQAIAKSTNLALMGSLDSGLGAKANTFKAKTKAVTQQARTELVDRLAPLRDLTKGKVGVDKDPYVQARLFSGHFGRIQKKLDELSDILRPNKADLPAAKKYAQLEREIELSNRGITKFEGGRTVEQIKAQKAKLDLSPNASRLQALTQQIRGYSDNLLNELREAGILSDEAYNAIKARNDKYIPFDRAEYLADQMDNLPRGTRSFSVSGQDVIKKLKGSEKRIADPIESLVKKTYKVINLVERNKVALKVADLAKDPNFSELVIPVKGELPHGMEKFSVFRNGVKEEYAVPKPVGDALKGMNQESIDLVTSVMNKISTAPLRAGATSLNVAFLPSNAIRDFQTAMLVSKVGFSPLEWIRGFGAAIGKGKLYKEFLDSGGSFSGFFEQNKNLPKTTRQLTRGKTLNAALTIVNPFKLIQKAGEVIELAPRLGVFGRSLRKGRSTTEAAFNAREATVDFAKAGTKLRIINMWVPFLNARLQGTINTFKAIKNRPLRSGLVVGTMIGLPTVATYLNNSRNHPDIWNDIAQYEKDGNFLIIYGDERDKDGNPTQVIKIPKGDVGRVYGNPLEHFLAYTDKADRKSLDQLAVALLSDISPVSFEREGKVSGTMALSSITPPAVKAGVESGTNTNLFTGRKIEPDYIAGVPSKDLPPEERFKDSTSPIAKGLGRAFNASPLKIENAAGTMFGGLGRQLINPFTAATQVSRRFVGAKGGAQEQDLINEVEGSLQGQALDKANFNRKAQQVFEKLEQSSNPAQDFDQLYKEDKDLAEKVAELKTEQKLGYTYSDSLIKQLQVENGERAKFIHSQFLKLQTKEEKAKLWDDYVTKKIITKDIAKQLEYLAQTK